MNRNSLRCFVYPIDILFINSHVLCVHKYVTVIVLTYIEVFCLNKGSFYFIYLYYYLFNLTWGNWGKLKRKILMLGLFKLGK